MNWKILALVTPLLFVSYQTLSKVLPKGVSVFLVNAYASFIGMIIMLLLHMFLSPDKSLIFTARIVPIVIGIGIFISSGNFGIIKAYSMGAPQSLFTPIFYVALIICGIIFGALIWHEKLNILQGVGICIAVVGLLMTVYFKK